MTNFCVKTELSKAKNSALIKDCRWEAYLLCLLTFGWIQSSLHVCFARSSTEIEETQLLRQVSLFPAEKDKQTKASMKGWNKDIMILIKYCSSVSECPLLSKAQTKVVTWLLSTLENHSTLLVSYVSIKRQSSLRSSPSDSIHIIWDGILHLFHSPPGVVAKFRIETNNLIPNSTNLSQRQHCLPFNFNNLIFRSTIFSQHQLHQPVKINNSKFVPTTKNSCQQIGSELHRFYREGLETKFVAQQDGGRHWSWNDTNSQWSLFFTDLDESLSDYEQFITINEWHRNNGKLNYSFGKCSSSFAKMYLSLYHKLTGN